MSATPKHVSIPCPFGHDCPNTLTATVYPGRRATRDDPAEPVTVENIRGCPEHMDEWNLSEAEWQTVLGALYKQLDRDDQDAKEQHDDQKIDEALGK